MYKKTGKIVANSKVVARFNFVVYLRDNE